MDVRDCHENCGTDIDIYDSCKSIINNNSRIIR